jgi:hypothetical protein
VKLARNRGTWKELMDKKDGLQDIGRQVVKLSKQLVMQGGALAPLRVRDFSLLFSGQLISIIGDAFYAVALPWFMLSGGGARRLSAAAGGIIVSHFGPTIMFLAWGILIGVPCVFGLFQRQFWDL